MTLTGEDVAIVGVGESALGKVAGKDSLGLCSDALVAALDDSGVSIGELDSGILWNNSGDMASLRAKVMLNVGELPAPKVDMGTPFDPSTHADCATARAATGGDYDEMDQAQWTLA